MPAIILEDYQKPINLIIEKNESFYEIVRGESVSFLFDKEGKSYFAKSGLAFMLKNDFNPFKEHDPLLMEVILEVFDGKNQFDTNV